MRPLRLVIPGVLAAALVASAGTAAAAPAAVVVAVRLPVPAGTTSSSASDVNNSGVVVGNATVTGVTQAAKWTGLRYTRLPASTDYPQAFASRINDAGLTVGAIEPTTLGYRTIRYWQPGGATTDCATTAYPLGVTDFNERGDALLSVITGPRQWRAAVCHADGTSLATNLSIAEGISDDGRVAGATSGTPANNYAYTPTVVAADGTETALPVPAGRSGAAYDFGPGGVIVGALGTNVVVGGPTMTFQPQRAVTWTGGGQPVELGTLGGDTSVPATGGRAVSRTGYVIGTSTTASGQTHAFLWRAGTITDLGTLGGDTSTPTAVNDRGQVVGYSTTASGAIHAFLYSGGRMTDLGTAGAGSSSAVDITDSGVIVGSVTRSDGTSAAVRWTVR